MKTTKKERVRKLAKSVCRIFKVEFSEPLLMDLFKDITADKARLNVASRTAISDRICHYYGINKEKNHERRRIL